ncbi:MAG: peptidylprolyl isomerase [Planctomycetota bacterium]|jgi:peptidyl-prolyl cis-trans isomerase B (cyclophilin B)
MAGSNPTVTFETDRGKIVAELYADKTPKTVENFVTLAEKGYFDGLKFHRVIPNFVIQGGCPKGTGTGGPGHTIDCELVPGLKHGVGTLSMAHASTCEHDRSSGAKLGGSCSNGSQFFIVRQPQPHLDMVHTVFGQVSEGQDVVETMQQGDAMNKVIITR